MIRLTADTNFAWPCTRIPRWARHSLGSASLVGNKQSGRVWKKAPQNTHQHQGRQKKRAHYTSVQTPEVKSTLAIFGRDLGGRLLTCSLENSVLQTQAILLISLMHHSKRLQQNGGWPARAIHLPQCFYHLRSEKWDCCSCRCHSLQGKFQVIICIVKALL